MLNCSPRRAFETEVPDEFRDRVASPFALVLCAECQEAMYLKSALVCGATILDAPEGRQLGVVDRCARCAAADLDTDWSRDRILRQIGTILAGAALITGAVVVAGL